MITRICKRHLVGLSFIICQLSFSVALLSCSDANEYEDSNTNNPSWIPNYTDSATIAHPDSLAQSKWVRGKGLKMNAFGEDIQGFVKNLNFVSADSVAVTMSQGKTEGTWVDDSNTEKLPYYEYTYNPKTGNLQILQATNNKGKITKKAIFMGVAVKGSKDVITLVHYGDSPSQTYLVRE